MSRRRFFKSFFYINYGGTAHGETVIVSPFVAGGASDTIELVSWKPWVITNGLSWLTVSSLSNKSGTYTITLTASQNTEHSQRTGSFTAKTLDDKYSIVISVSQEAAPSEKYLRIDPTSVNMAAVGTYNALKCYFSYNGSETEVTPTWSSNNTAVTISTYGVLASNNTTTNPLTVTITATYVDGGDTLTATSIVNVAAAGAYFYIGSSVANALSTSATTYAYPTTVASADTASKTVYFATNYSASEVEALAVNYPSSISNVSVNTSNSSITFNFIARPIVTGDTATTRNATITVGTATITATQAAPAYFKWNSPSVTVGSAAGSTGSNTYSSNIAYGDITPSKSSTGTFITTGPTMNNTGVTFSVAANTTTEDKTCTITASLGSTTLDTFTVTQNGADAYFWTGSMNVTAATTSVDSTGQTGCEVQCYSNRSSSYLNAITVSGDSSSWITNISWNPSTQKVTFNVSSYGGTDSRSGIIGIYNSTGTMIGSINVNQGAAAPYFRFVPNSSTAYTYNTDTSAATAFTVAIDTNYNLSDIKTTRAGSGINTHTYSSTTEVGVTTSSNPYDYPRTGYIYFYTGATYNTGRIGVLTVTQDAGPYARITGGGNYSTGATAGTVYFETNFDSFSLSYLRLEVSGDTWLSLDSYSTPLVDSTNYTYRLSSNTGTSQRTGYILLKDTYSNQTIDFATINQEGQGLPTYYLYFTNYSSVTARTVTVNSADTSYSEAITYNYPSLSTEKTGNISSVSYSYNSMTANFDANTSRDERTVGTATVTGTGGAGAPITLKLEIKQYGVPAYLTWDDGTTSASVNASSTGGSNTKTVRTNWTTAELNALTVSSSVDWLTGGSITTASASYSVGGNPAGGSSRNGTITWKNGSTTVLTLTVNQEAGESYYFNWSGGTSAASTTNISSAATSAGNKYSTNYPSITFEHSGMTTGVTTGASSSVTANFTTNPAGSSSRSGWIIAFYGSTVVGVWSLTQNAGASYEFYWENSSSTISVNVTSSATNTTVIKYHSTYPNTTFDYGGMVTGVTDNGNNGVVARFTANSTTSERTGYVYAKSNGTTIGTMTITQAGMSYYFTWERGDSTSVAYNSIAATNTYSTNYSSITFTTSGIVTSVSTGSSSSVTANYSNNTTKFERTGWVIAKYGSTTVGTWTITQQAQPSRTINIYGIQPFICNYNSGPTISSERAEITLEFNGGAAGTGYLTWVSDNVGSPGGSKQFKPAGDSQYIGLEDVTFESFTITVSCAHVGHGTSYGQGSINTSSGTYTITVRSGTDDERIDFDADHFRDFPNPTVTFTFY